MIPLDPTTPEAGTAGCQAACLSQSYCQFFTYNVDDYTCSLYTGFDFNNCLIVSGDTQPPYAECLPSSAQNCNDFAWVRVQVKGSDSGL